MIEPSPSAKGPNGRDDHGRFLPGHAGGPGNPHARQVAKLRSALLNAVTEEDMDAIVRKLVEQAKEGDIHAAKEVILRTLGRPVESDLLERLEQLEEVMSHRTPGGAR